MSITTYSELQTAVQNLFNDTASLVAARVQEHITLAEAFFRRELRCRDMETTADITINAQTAALPTDFVGMRRLYLSGDPNTELDFFQPDDFYRRYASSQTAKPKIYTIEAGNFVFGPTPDTTYTGKVLYYKWPGALSASNTPALFTNNPDLYLYGSAYHSAEYLNDTERAMKYAALVQRIMTDIQKSDERDRFGRAQLVARSDVMA